MQGLAGSNGERIMRAALRYVHTTFQPLHKRALHQRPVFGKRAPLICGFLAEHSTCGAVRPIEEKDAMTGAHKKDAIARVAKPRKGAWGGSSEDEDPGAQESD